jgi:serine/threonine-protein kinase
MISELGSLSAAATISYGIQICHLVSFLHSAKPNPILYLDLHPRNLMICGGTVKLVDFDHAVHLDEAGQMTRRYGAVGFAAPEQYTGKPLDERTDIYAIGAVLYYMLTGAFPERYPVFSLSFSDGPIFRIIRKCLRENPSQRYASAAELSDSLEHLQKQRKIYGQSEPSDASSLSIAVAGAFPGAGATHIAIGLTVWLCRHGRTALYEEKNDSGAVQQLAEWKRSERDENGICRIRGIPMLPNYGPAVKLEQAEYPVRVCDYGVADEHFRQYPADGYLLVCGSRPWEWKKSRSALAQTEPSGELCVLYNHYGGDRTSCLPAPGTGTPCFLMPCVSDPWAAGIPAQKVYGALWQTWTGKKEEGFMKRWFGRGRKTKDGKPWES